MSGPAARPGKPARDALRAIARLAAAGGSVTGASVLAAECGTSVVSLGTALRALAKHGLVRGIPGPRGGYRLARAASEISVLEVLEAAGGPMRDDRCPVHDRACFARVTCPVHDLWTDGQERMRTALARMAIDALVRELDSAGSVDRLLASLEGSPR